MTAMSDPQPPTAGDPGRGPRPRATRQQRLLNQARKHPQKVLRDRRCLKPGFCAAFFEICEDQALQDPRSSLRFARAASELARKIGDPHLIHRSQGILVYAHIAERQVPEARRLLEDYRLAAASCCKPCSADWLRRRAEVLIEDVDGKRICATVERSRRELGDGIDADTDARLRFVESIGNIYQMDGDAALENADKVLRELDLSSPRGYFLDTLALLGWYLKKNTRPRRYRVAAEILTRFQERLKGLRGWTDVRIRKSWVEGQIYGHLGEWRKAADLLETARRALLGSGPPRHAVGVTFDLCQLYARRINDVSMRAVQRMLGVCRRQRALDREMRRRMKHLVKHVSWYPERVPLFLAGCRNAFIVPVPGLLTGLAVRQVFGEAAAGLNIEVAAADSIWQTGGEEKAEDEG